MKSFSVLVSTDLYFLSLSFFIFLNRKILNKSTVQTFHLIQNFLIVLTQEFPNVRNLLHDIFGIVLHLGLLNVNVLVKHENVPLWSLFFYKPYAQSCHSIDVIKIETFSPNNYTVDLSVPFDNLFPSREFKFKNCPLFISTFSVEPYVIIQNSNGSKTYHGVDVTIVNEIAKTLHLIPKYLQPPDGRNRGTIYKNGTATGAQKMVIDGDANMTVGTYALSMERVNLMSYSRSYTQNALIFAFKKNAQLTTPLARLMSPFQTFVWISIAFLLFISILVILLTKKLSMQHRHFMIGGQMNRTPILNMINMVIGNSIANPKMTQERHFGVFARTLCILWLFFWLIVRNSYQGSLYETLRGHRVESSYDTIEKVRMSTAKIYITGTANNLLPEGFNSAR